MNGSPHQDRKCDPHEVVIGARRFEASCRWGFTQADLECHFGAVAGEPHPLWRQLAGQTGVLCDVHGPVSYVSDVAEWVRGEPVSDW